MDQALKARLIGAGVLVAAAVLLIPELLSGRKSVESLQSVETAPSSSPATRTYTIELGSPPGSDTATTDIAEVVPTPPASQVEPVTAAAPYPEPEAPRAAATAAEVPEVEPSVSKAPSVAPATTKTALDPGASVARVDRASPVTGGWSVQVGAFGSSAAALKLENDLQGAGFDAYVSPTKRGGQTLHRVRVGPEPARADAVALADRLKKRGLPVSLVANE